MKAQRSKAALLLTTLTALTVLTTTALTALTGATSQAASPYGKSAAAAGLEKVGDFGSNPGALSMYRYAPDGLPKKSPVVLALHGCTQDAATYFEGAGWQKAADDGKFAVVAPQQEQANNAKKCFNWFQSGDTDRDKGEAQSIKQMVDRTVADLDADPSRVFITGLSAGGAMTASMLAAYPDVFKGGAIVAGLPHGCANTVAEAFTCMNPGASKKAADWGDLVRAENPDYSGARPKVSVWHGTGDTTVAPMNAEESVKQWTDVLGADQKADATEKLQGGTTRSDYRNADGDVVVRGYLVDGMPHGTPVKPDEGCGKAGKHFLDTICSTRHITADWGLGG
ncbi:extracellular catalytic domain type 1 short-chain-length polyhydroxyalkanoate depolymerase [Streptomyces marispadix]|uniref:PHB depolymerase family esterase n=1 Tax=Streptomyces marispadix TaxID=2922868 RepID=A0ABS9SYF4_9ACTN|nr:PHB depolymerase family esterase [Streptomyces marispadix]MCH6161076.1 PHB depolymerase family esterase [Streptomyces marispadix]